MNDMERRYTTKDIADMLGVEAVTIRKYALALEKAGYIVDRINGKNRAYSERDAWHSSSFKLYASRLV